MGRPPGAPTCELAGAAWGHAPSPALGVQRQTVDASPCTQDVESPADGQELQVPHLVGKLVHRLGARRARSGEGTRGPGSPRNGAARPPAPRSPSASLPPGRTHRRTRALWTERSPPHDAAHAACPPPGLRAGSRSRTGSAHARKRPPWCGRRARAQPREAVPPPGFTAAYSVARPPP